MTYNFENKRILIVEDDDSSFYLLNALLKRSKANVIRAYNGIEALEVFKYDPDLDLIIIDVVLPKLDGIATTKEIRKVNLDIPVLIHSAQAYQTKVKEAFEAGCTDFLAKPSPNSQVMYKVSQLLYETKDAILIVSD